MYLHCPLDYFVAGDARQAPPSAVVQLIAATVQLAGGGGT